MSGPVVEIKPSDLAARLNGPEPLTVLDVREPSERSTCAIRPPASVVDLHIPLGQVTSSLEAIRAAALGRSLVVYCHHGVRSMMAAEWLAAQGVGPVLNLEGGIDGWSLGVDPSTRRY